MLNVYDTIRSGLFFNKFEIGELLFVEYTCPIEEEALAVWTPCDYVLHVLSGTKRWRSGETTWTATAGDSYYVRKGAYVIEQFFEEEFCMLLFFLSDDFLRDTVHQASPPPRLHDSTPAPDAPVIAIHTDLTLTTYFQSMLAWFTNRERPPEALLTVKLAELVLNILQSTRNRSLAAYFASLLDYRKPSLVRIMNENFRYNLSLADFARLCHRSLSSFRRDFRACFNMAPGRWLLQKRLHHAASLMGNADQSITQIALESGFTNLAHFSRAFRDAFRCSPTEFRRALPRSGPADVLTTQSDPLSKNPPAPKR